MKAAEKCVNILYSNDDVQDESGNSGEESQDVNEPVAVIRIVKIPSLAMRISWENAQKIIELGDGALELASIGTYLCIKKRGRASAVQGREGDWVVFDPYTGWAMYKDDVYRQEYRPWNSADTGQLKTSKEVKESTMDDIHRKKCESCTLYADDHAYFAFLK